MDVIANLSILLEPFLPFSSKKLRTTLSLDEPAWKPVSIPAGTELGNVEILFERLDKKVISEERTQLYKKQSNTKGG